MGTAAQEWLAVGAILFGIYLLLVQLPIFGIVLKLTVRIAWVFAPLVIIVGAAAFVWYEGWALIFGDPVATPVVVAEDVERAVVAPAGNVPLPVPRPTAD
ncbi:MAG: hypothetical protein AAGJ28_12645 [Pseudomonadota bacterium]